MLNAKYVSMYLAIKNCSVHCDFIVIACFLTIQDYSLCFRLKHTSVIPQVVQKHKRPCMDLRGSYLWTCFSIFGPSRTAWWQIANFSLRLSVFPEVWDLQKLFLNPSQDIGANRMRELEEQPVFISLPTSADTQYALPLYVCSKHEWRGTCKFSKSHEVIA